MSVHIVDFQQTKLFKPIIHDFLSLNHPIKHFYAYHHDIDSYENLINQKKSGFDIAKRSELVEILKQQHQNYVLSKQVLKNIELLKNNKTFTVTTGHQLNLMTGPAYYFYKTLSTIKLAELLQKKFPDYNFVPMFWLASEDHDFNEVNHFYFHDQKIEWRTESHGAVGRLSTQKMHSMLQTLQHLWGTHQNARALLDVFEIAYTKYQNWTDATRYMVNHFFGQYGLVTIDGDDKRLKKQLVPVIKQEIKDKVVFNHVTATNQKLKEYGYHIQINPREINLFYLDEKRTRLAYSEDFHTTDNERHWTLNQLLEEIELHPEKFSPNALMRPVYQEVVLPNLAYVGGAGELAYWLQLKSSFEAFQVSFPKLILRDSVLMMTQKNWHKAQKLNLEAQDFFLPLEDVLKNYTKKISEKKISFEALRIQLKQQFESLENQMNDTHKSFENALKAQKQKQINGLNKLEKRWWKAEQLYYQDTLNRVKILHEYHSPNNELQERKQNFSVFYLGMGPDFVSKVYDSMNPFDCSFKLIIY